MAQASGYQLLDSFNSSMPKGLPSWIRRFKRFRKASDLDEKTEPMKPSIFPELSWQKVGMDLFEWQKLVCLKIVDYYSRFIGIAQLDRTTAEAAIQCCKNIFLRHGIPEEIVMDNGSQFDSYAFHMFSKEYIYQFHHVTSSPYYPRSNEREIKIVKALLKKGDKPYLALLAYRSTQLSNGYLPAELLMNRKLRTNVPSSREAWKLHVLDRKLVVEREEEQRQK